MRRAASGHTAVNCRQYMGITALGQGTSLSLPSGDMAVSCCIVAFGDGPAMSCDTGGAPTVSRCVFSGNAGGDEPCQSYRDILYEDAWFCAWPIEG